MAFNPRVRQQFAVPASFLIKYRQNRMIYANAIIQQQALEQGCSGSVGLQSGGTADGAIVPKLLEGARYTTAEERDRILATSRCSDPQVSDEPTPEPPPTPPPTPVVYIFTEQTDSPSMAYRSLTVTSDFTTHIITRSDTLNVNTQGPYISIDSGATWTRKTNGMTFATTPTRAYTSGVTVAKSNPLIMYTANRRNFESNLDSTFDDIYKSTDGGDNWSVISPVQATWASITCSYDGSVVLVGNSNGPDLAPPNYDRKMVLSTDGGVTWTIQSPLGQFLSVAMSSDGTYLYAVTTGRRLDRSSDGGVTWEATTWTVASGDSSRTVKCSADGQTVIIGRVTSYPLISKDAGVTLTAITDVPIASYSAVNISDDGNVIAVAADTSSNIWISTDAGETWYEQEYTGNWIGLAIDADGSNIGIGPTSGKYYVGVPA